MKTGAAAAWRGHDAGDRGRPPARPARQHDPLRRGFRGAGHGALTVGGATDGHALDMTTARRSARSSMSSLDRTRAAQRLEQLRQRWNRRARCAAVGEPPAAPPAPAPVVAAAPVVGISIQSRWASLSRRCRSGPGTRWRPQGIVTPNAALADWRPVPRHQAPADQERHGQGRLATDQPRQPDHGDQRGGRRRQELHVDQSGDEHRGRAGSTP